MTPFEASVMKEVYRVRERLKEESLGLNSFNFTIEAEGRVHEGETNVEFKLYVNYGDTVKGGSVDAVLEEVLRQHGWKRRNDPLKLSHVPAEKTEGVEDAF